MGTFGSRFNTLHMTYSGKQSSAEWTCQNVFGSKMKTPEKESEKSQQNKFEIEKE